MITNGQIREKILSETLELSTEERLLLVQQIIESLLVPSIQRTPQPIRYGQFANPARALSTEQDFVIAEWHPSEQQLNGE